MTKSMERDLAQHSPLLIADHFDGECRAGFVVIGLDHLTKRTFPNHFKDLVAIAYVIMKHLHRQDDGGETERPGMNDVDDDDDVNN